jgi:hypothetical protein
MFVLYPIFDMGADIADRRFVPTPEVAGHSTDYDAFASLP